MIYFDNSASTPLSPGVKTALREEMEYFANPSSLHRLGFEAEKRLDRARGEVAASLGVLPEEIVFTGGGTEADNLAVFGAAEKMHRRGKKILATNSEHPAVESSLKKLEEKGFTVVRLSTRGGKLDLEEVSDAADENTVLAAVMHTNNETGAVYDVSALSRIVKKKNPEALVFSDAVQGYLKSPLNPRSLGVDLLSLSAHKVNGPKGVGALYIKKGLSLPPLILGGGQERGFRSGTENLPGIVAFGRAAREGREAFEENRKQMARVRETVLEGLRGESRVKANLPENPSCHILSLQVEGYPSEVLLHMLSEREVFVSSGSACSSKKGKSPVLRAFGLSQKESDCTIRLSFSPANTVEEGEAFVKILSEILL